MVFRGFRGMPQKRLPRLMNPIFGTSDSSTRNRLNTAPAFHGILPQNLNSDKTANNPWEHDLGTLGDLFVS